MNNILISNPFLFRPDSPDSTSQEPRKSPEEYFTDFKDLNLNYQKSEFDKAWEEISWNEEILKKSPVKKVNKTEEAPSSYIDNSLFSVSSPTISTSSESSDLDDLFPMESWADSCTINFSDIYEPDAETSVALTTASSDYKNDDMDIPMLSQLDELDFDDVLDTLGMNDEKYESLAALKKEQDILCQLSNTKALPTLTMAFHNKSIPAKIQDMAMLLPPSPQNLIAIGAENEVTVGVLQAQINIAATNARGGHKRKEALEHRMVAPSPLHNHEEVEQVDKKPDVTALGINNGQQREGAGELKRRMSASGGPSSKNNPNKKPRKYELSAEDDPSVKNAIAAKMNRERKKRENLEMRGQIETLTKDKVTLQSALDLAAEEAAKYKTLYYQEKQKNVMSDGIRNNITNVKKILEAVIPPLNRSFGPMEVDIPEGFASIPARIAEDGSVETFANAEGDFNILDPDYQMISSQELVAVQGGQQGSAEDTSTFTTFHISPTERKIRLEYNPSFQSFLG